MTAWLRVSTGDPAVRALRDRHYSTKKPGGRTVGPPGRRLAFRTVEGDAAWVTHWPDPRLALDGVDAWRCSLFRNESGRRASDLIREAMALTAAIWADRPCDGWLTYVEPGKLTSEVAGYCFRRAGWRRDRTWRPKSARLIRLRAAIR
jgi:hypothetical protein